jgi:transposase
LASDALDECRRRIQRDTFGRRARKDDPLYKSRRTLHTGAGLLTEKQQARLEALFSDEQHVEVEATWGIYQRMITAYQEPNKKLGKFVMQHVIDSLTNGLPAGLEELRRLGRTLKDGVS